MARLVGELNVKYCVVENVQPLIAMRDVWSTILTEFWRRGYVFRWCCVSSKNAGSPQSRRRWFGLAIRRDVIKENGFFGIPEVEPITLAELDKRVQGPWNGEMPPLEHRMAFNPSAAPIEGRLYATPEVKTRLRQLGNQVSPQCGEIAFRMLAAKDTQWF